MHFASNIIYAKYMVIASLIHISVGRIQNCVDSKFELNNLNHLKKNLNNAADDKKKVWSAIPPLPYYFKDRSPRKIQNLGLCSLQFRTTGNWHIFTTVLISSFFPGNAISHVCLCLFVFQCRSPGGARTNVYSVFSPQRKKMKLSQISTNYKFLFMLHCSPIWIFKLFTKYYFKINFDYYLYNIGQLTI